MVSERDERRTALSLHPVTVEHFIGKATLSLVAIPELPPCLQQEFRNFLLSFKLLMT